MARGATRELVPPQSGMEEIVSNQSRESFMNGRKTVVSFFLVFFFNLPSVGTRTNCRTVFLKFFFWSDEDF
jgi:hypothetical protein